jgi:hypothetical protein
MEHPYTWYNALPEKIQHLFDAHTFFAVIAGLILICFAVKLVLHWQRQLTRSCRQQNLGSRNIAELLVQLIVSQSDAIIGKNRAQVCAVLWDFFFSLFY